MPPFGPKCFGPALTLVFLALLVSPALYGRGRDEVPEEVILNPEWTLSVTRFDDSALPASQKILTSIVIRTIVKNLTALDKHIRPGGESDFYRDYSWSKKKSEAAQALAKKRGERDTLLFKGEKRWKYRRERKRLDEEIVELEEALKLAEETAPLVESKPLFKLSEASLTEEYPEPPEAGTEYSFCQKNNIDAFLSGKVSEYYGRTYLELSLYTLSAQSYVYEDAILFSHEEQDIKIAEIAERLAAQAAGTGQSQILVKVKPPDALAFVNTIPVPPGGERAITVFPGDVKVQVYADNYETAETEIEIMEGQAAELSFNLIPLMRDVFEITTPDESGASVYQGAFYIGKTPLLIEVPQRRYSHIHVETPSGDTAQAVFRGQNGESVLYPKNPEIPEGKSVEALRRKFYGAFGRFWIGLPVAMLFYGMAEAEAYKYNESRSQQRDLWQNAANNYYRFFTAAILTGCFAVEAVVRYLFYTRAGSKGANGVLD